MFFRLLCLFLFFSSAHATPQYALADTNMTQITFDNQAVFQTDIFHEQAMSDWIAGDILELSHGFSSVDFLMATQLRDDLLILVPKVQITNTTRNSKIPAHLLLVTGLGILSV